MHHNKSMYITNVEKEGPFLKIWGQTNKKSALEVEQALLRASERFEEGKYKLKTNGLEVGVLCCAKYVDEKYYRARVTSTALVADGMVEINFLDYGNKDVVSTDNLRSLDCFNHSFISLAPLSSPFILAEVVCLGGEWNDDIINQIAKDIRYIETNIVIVAQAVRYYLIKVFIHNVDLGLHLVGQNLMQSTSIQTQEAVLLAMIPRTPQPGPQINQPLLQFRTVTLEPSTQHEVYVSYITDGPCHFSVQMKKYESVLAHMMTEINSVTLKPLEELPMPGTICLAKCLEDSNICRAVVTNEVDSSYKLFYVDFGNSEIVPPENLYQITPKFIIPKVMAIRLSLAGIEKSSMTLEMQCAFKKFVDNRLLVMEVLPTQKKMALPKCKMWDPETNTDVMETLNRAAECAYPDSPRLHKGFTQPVKVSFVHSCNRFYVQLKSKESELNKLMANLQPYCNSKKTPFIQEARVGQPCCALFSYDQQWYRSLITEVSPNNVRIRYVDYGNEDDVTLNTLKTITGEHLTILRPQAIECCLNGYQNMAEDKERDNKLEEIILEQEYTMKVIDTTNNKLLVDLIDASNTTVSALLLETLIAQTKQISPIETRPATRGNWASPEKDQHNHNQKDYFQHDDRRPPRSQGHDSSWRQNSQKRDSLSPEAADSWRQDNRGFRDRKENDCNQRPSNDHSRRERGGGFRERGREESSNNNEKPYRSRGPNEDWKSGSSNTEKWNGNNTESRSHNNDQENTDSRNQNRAPRSHNKDRENTDSWNQNRTPRNRNNDRENNDSWSETRAPRGINSDNTESWNQNRPPRNHNNDRENTDSWNQNKPPRTRNPRDNDGGGKKSEGDEWNNKSSAEGDNWGEKKEFKRPPREEWASNQGNSDRKFGDRNREDRGNFRKKPFRREGSEISSSGSEKSFGKGLRTSSRNDNRPPRFEKKFANKSSDNSWNISNVPSVIDSAPNDAIFKELDLVGRQEKVTISWFHNPSSFFCQLVDSQEQFQKLMQDIQEAYKGRPSGSCVVGAPAIGLFPEDNVLYRAKILEVIGSNRYKIYYVDFGNISIIEKVWPIENKFMDMPMQAVPCSLSNIVPADADWPNPDNFSQYFEKGSLECNFLKKENERYEVNLIADNEDIAQQIVNNALGKYSSSVEDYDISLLVGQQFRAMLKNVNNLADFTMLLQSGLSLSCSIHNLASATEINEDVLRQQLEQILIVYADDLVENRLEVTLYDSTGNKLNIISPDEGAFDTVELLCPHLVIKSTIQGFVPHVNETSIVIQPTECSQNIDIFLEQMYEYYDNLPPDNPLIPEEEFVYAVKSSDGNWYRGRVTNFDNDKATVVYVDYGNSEDVEFSRLRELIPEFMQWETMAVLVNVKVPTSEFLERDVAAAIFYGEAGWEGEIQVNESISCTEQPSVEFAEVSQPSASLPSPSVDNTNINIQSESSLQSPSIDNSKVNEQSESSLPSVANSNVNEQGESSLPSPSVDNTNVNEANESSGIETENSTSCGTLVVLSHINSPSDFYIHLADSVAALDDLQVKLQEKIGEMAPLESATVGGLCAAPYVLDQQWYRSQILDADADITTVRFIDYGNTDVIDNKTTQIKTLPAELLSLEEYATRCRLKIKPCIEEEWCKAALERFEALTSVENIRVEFKDQDEKTNYVELYSDGINVKDILIQDNLAALDEAVIEGKSTGFVSHLNSPSEFWIQLESCCAELEWIAEELSNAASFPDLEDLTPGSLCAAMFPDDEMWYRARILSNTVAGIEVLFVDYGNSCTCSNLKQLPEHLVMAPPLAQKCSLQKPEGLLNWSPEASEKFIEISANGQTIFTVKKMTIGETSVVELHVNDEDISTKLLPTTDNGYVTDIESIESFSITKDGISSEVKHKLEKMPGTDYDEVSHQKFVEISNEGKTLFDVEYLSENVVRLYLNGKDIRKDLSITSKTVKQELLAVSELNEKSDDSEAPIIEEPTNQNALHLAKSLVTYIIDASCPEGETANEIVQNELTTEKLENHGDESHSLTIQMKDTDQEPVIQVKTPLECINMDNISEVEKSDEATNTFEPDHILLQNSDRQTKECCEGEDVEYQTPITSEVELECLKTDQEKEEVLNETNPSETDERSQEDVIQEQKGDSPHIEMINKAEIEVGGTVSTSLEDNAFLLDSKAENISESVETKHDGLSETSQEEEIGLTPQIQKETDLIPQLQKETNLTPQIEEDTVLTPQIEEETFLTPQTKGKSVLTPPIQEETVLTPPIQEETVLTPPIQEETVSTPQIQEETDLTPRIQKETDLTPQIQKETDSTPRMQKETEISPEIEKDVPETNPSNPKINSEHSATEIEKVDSPNENDEVSNESGLHDSKIDECGNQTETFKMDDRSQTQPSSDTESLNTLKKTCIVTSEKTEKNSELQFNERIVATFPAPTISGGEKKEPRSTSEADDAAVHVSQQKGDSD